MKTRLTRTHRPDARTHPKHRSRNLKSGRLQPPKSMGSLLNARITRGAPLSATTGNTHAPDPMTGYNLHRSICVACTRTGVINLLGRTLLSEGPVAARYTARCKSKTRSRQTQEVLLKYHQCSFISITRHHCVNKGPCPLACPNQQQHLCPHVTTCMPDKLV